MARFRPRLRDHRHAGIGRGPAGAEVRVSGIVGCRHRPEAARQRVEVVGIDTGRRDEGVVALADHHQVAVRDPQHLLLTIRERVKALDAVAAWLAEAVVVRLLQVSLDRWIVPVVLVRRIARPVARGREHLADEQPVRFSRRRQDVDDLPRGVAAASHLEAAVLRADHTRREPPCRRRSAFGNLGGPLRPYLERRARRQIQRVRVAGEHVAARTEAGAAGFACHETRPPKPARQGAPGRPRRRRCGCSRCSPAAICRTAKPTYSQPARRGVSASCVPDRPLGRARLCRSVLGLVIGCILPAEARKPRVTSSNARLPGLAVAVTPAARSRSTRFPPVGRSSAPRSRRSPRPAPPRHLPR